MRKVDWHSLINSANFRQLDNCFCTTTCEADEERQANSRQAAACAHITKLATASAP